MFHVKHCGRSGARKGHHYTPRSNYGYQVHGCKDRLQGLFYCIEHAFFHGLREQRDIRGQYTIMLQFSHV